MKKLIFVLIIMLSSHSFAQSFFDTDAFSLKGDVSSCVVVTTGLFLHNKGVFEFDINKNLIKAQYKYPNSDFTMVEAVRIADALIVTLKNGCRYQYIIDEDRKLRFERYLINGKYSSISGYSYEKEEIKKGISYIPSSLESVYLPENFDLSDISDSRIRRNYFEYTDYKYDSKGNWISRTRVMDGDKYKEERTIKYWSSSTSTSANSKSSLTNSPSEQIKAEGEFPIPSNNFKQMTKEDLESYAKRGIAEAQYELGNRIFDNSNWKNEEVEMAKYWFGKAVEQSHPQAHLKLGFIYSGQAYWLYNNEGPNHEAYKKNAFDIYLKGAKLGEINCQMWVGEYYHNGRYAPKNEEQALYWTRKAAEQGQEAAKRHLKEWGYK